jgi:uncharacterized protein (DUF2267 family)
MTTSNVTALDHTVHETGAWLDDLAGDGPFANREQAYSWLRAVLHSLRDRLNVDEATHLAAQLPMLVRGFYYEGWRPALAPNAEETPREFYASVAESLQGAGPDDPDVEAAVRAVFALLQRRLTGGQVRHVLSQLPSGIQELWASEVSASS